MNTAFPSKNNSHLQGTILAKRVYADISGLQEAGGPGCSSMYQEGTWFPLAVSTLGDINSGSTPGLLPTYYCTLNSDWGRGGGCAQLSPSFLPPSPPQGPRFPQEVLFGAAFLWVGMLRQWACVEPRDKGFYTSSVFIRPSHVTGEGE